MNLFSSKDSRIKNIKARQMPKDFSYNAFSFFILALFISAGAVLQILLASVTDIEILVQIAGGFVFLAVIIAALPTWSMVILLCIAMTLSLYYQFEDNYSYLLISGLLGLVFSSSAQLVYHWDKVVILRMGQFKKVHGPGLFFLFPLVDRTAAFIDTRIRATDFSAEKTLTHDTVPVHVDALCFWMIWNARKAVLEVEDYLEAVTLSAQTALRDSIGKYDLQTLLSERERLGQEIQEILDKKTNPWGISIMSVEITDVIIPHELEDAMSRQAQAERERQSRVILSKAEVEIASHFEEASLKYKNNPTALQLRAMNMVYEGIKMNKNSMMLMPSSILDQMDVGQIMGAGALGRQVAAENREEEQSDD